MAMKYWAFISYSHHDKRIARWLRDEFAKRPVSASLRATVEPAERRLRAVFLDEDEAGARSRRCFAVNGREIRPCNDE